VTDADAELVATAYEAFNRGDESFLEYLDPEVEWIPAPQFVEGPVHGIDELRRLLDTFREAFEEIRWVPQGVLLAPKPGEVLVLIETFTRGRGSGAEMRVSVAHRVRVRDGKIVWGKVYPNAEEGLRAAGIDPGLAT
jgi:ketosteroid isomerase-like protein